MVVSFTASCRAYRRCGLKWIASLYGLIFLCHFLSFAELVVLLYMDWWWDYHRYEVLTILVGVSSALWLVCVILALSIPPFDTSTCSNNEEPTNNAPRGSAVHPAPDNNRNEEAPYEEEDTYVQVKTVTAVPIPNPGLEEPSTQNFVDQNNIRFQKYTSPSEPYLRSS